MNYATSESLPYDEDISLPFTEAYREYFDHCKTLPISLVNSDETAYAYLIQNVEQVSVQENQLQLSLENAELSSAELAKVRDFVERLNYLLSVHAIAIESSLLIVEPQVSTMGDVIIQPQAVEVNILDDSRTHAAELRSVYDNAPTGLKTATAGAYFAARVKVEAYGI